MLIEVTVNRTTYNVKGYTLQVVPGHIYYFSIKYK